MNKKNDFRINLLREQYKKNKDNIKGLMIGMSYNQAIAERPLTEEEVDSFFLEGTSDKLKGADYVAIAIAVAKAICKASKVICPYIEVLP